MFKYGEYVWGPLVGDRSPLAAATNERRQFPVAHAHPDHLATSTRIPMSSFYAVRTLAHFQNTLRAFSSPFLLLQDSGCVGSVKWAGEYFHIHMNVKVALKMFLRPCNNSKRIQNEMNRRKKCDTSLLKFQEKITHHNTFAYVLYSIYNRISTTTINTTKIIVHKHFST